MVQKLKLGIIGMSEGNGHPYSWAAIFNGYDKDEMERCPFRAIPEYLQKEIYPDNFLNNYAEVTHIWTQNLKTSKQIALASNISKICAHFEEMIGEIDGLLLARDDAENHYKFAHKFLSAGIPVYIDKPFALNIASANKLWEKAIFKDQIFTCSALQFAKEFQSDQVDYNGIGEIKRVWASTPKSWDKYAVHIIEPVLNLLPNRGKIRNILPVNHGAYVDWESEVSCIFQTTGELVSPIWIRLQGAKGIQDFYFKDSFYAFKKALNKFVDVVNKTSPNLSINNTREMVEILEQGKNA
jgi:hypothetical protein